MTLADQSICQLIKRLQLLILAMKCLCKVFVPFPQGLYVVNGALVHSATETLLMHHHNTAQY